MGVGGSLGLGGEGGELNLCHTLQRGLCQLVLLFEAYLKLLDATHLVTGSPQASGR